MPSIWVESLSRSFDEALGFLAATVQDCPDDLWTKPMWEVPADLFGEAPPGPDGQPMTDATARYELVQRRSTPCSVAWHALEVLDYDLNGEFAPWAPPPPFTDHPHWQMTTLPRAWTRDELLGYIAYCRQRVTDVFATMTDDDASTPLPAVHRYAGQPHLSVITAALAHTVEHATQIQQFASGNSLRP
jgi:hypothetical protein